MRHSIVVMGVSGSGKSLIGRMLAERLKLDFCDGDDLHPEANVTKMASGQPLTDADRWPWLALVGERLAPPHPPAVIACSALKRAYRDHIRAKARRAVTFVLLEGSRAVLRERLGRRKGHFMPTALLASQLDTLEMPGPDELSVVVDVTPPPEEVLSRILAALPQAGP